uniref:Uncharacterized protein n=1 Tax=Rhizophora mucronata TaxID=61149 RepID=A0A2P2PDF6_RHIMU
MYRYSGTPTKLKDRINLHCLNYLVYVMDDCGNNTVEVVIKS